MPLISVITAVHAAGADYLDETIAAVEQQELPPGWSLEWVIQEDGDSPCLEEWFSEVPCAKYDAAEKQLGIGGTRNLALARSAGDLIQVLDSDDLLLPGALNALSANFEDSRVHWAVGQADDLLPDGTRVSWESALPYGLIPPGAVNQWAAAHGANWPVHGAGLMLRADILRALGGWVALPTDEDIAMLSALSELTHGFNHGAVTWLYRQHPAQVTRRGIAGHLSESSRTFALARANAVRTLGLRLGQPHSGGTLPVEVGPAAKDQTR